MLQRAASNAYSWWWASHIRTKQSKWLDSNLQEMEHKVKCILLLLGEEADSFAKRAEMYYKRRPEVISSVEESYRAYRALAERYDHISGELHKANHTIATAFPDQVQYAMLEEEDVDNLPKAFTPIDSGKIHKPTVEGLMMKKKKRPGGPPGPKSTPPVHKENAQEEISRLQKAILVMQTEKEFIKSCYESGIAKYWDLEKQINDMQEEVCCIQDEFNASAVIEDDEARACMTATALKSCQDAILRLQEQQKSSHGQAKMEAERVNASTQKLKALMSQYGKKLSDTTSTSTSDKNPTNVEDFYCMKQERFELQDVVDKIRRHFETDPDNLSVVEIAEKIDELVGKVVELELTVSSQTAQINRLCQENTELEKSLQSLEEEKAALGGSASGKLTEKLGRAEEELIRVQTLEESFLGEESTVRSNFAEALSSFTDISQMLQSPAPEHRADSALMLTDEEEAAPPPVDDKDIASPSADEETRHTGDEEPGDPLEAQAARALEPVSTVDVGIPPDVGLQKNVREKGSLERLLHISCDGPEEFEVKQQQEEETSKQDSSASEQKADQVEEDSEARENSTPSSGKCGEFGDQEGDINSQQLPADGVEGREKVLLAEYTSILQSYKDAKRQLTEVEAKNQESLHEMTAVISELRCANAIKDEEIRSLRELLGTSKTACNGNVAEGDGPRRNPSVLFGVDRETPRNGTGHGRQPSIPFPDKDAGVRNGHRRTPSFSSIHQRRQSISSIARLIRRNSGLQDDVDVSNHVVTEPESLSLEDDLRLPPLAEPRTASPLEEKFRRDIDALLEENLEFWLKFSTSFQRIQEFQSQHDALLSAIDKPADDWQEANGNGNNPSPEKHLRALKTELQVWLEQNAMLRGELHCRLTSLTDVQEEIAGALQRPPDAGEGEQFTSYQAAKFQGEVLNMQQENNKVAGELRAGLEHVRGLQAETEKALARLHKSVSLSGAKAGGGGSRNLRQSPSKTRVPLRSFLFPSKNKKPSLFACVNPAMQKQHGDMRFSSKLD